MAQKSISGRQGQRLSLLTYLVLDQEVEGSNSLCESPLASETASLEVYASNASQIFNPIRERIIKKIVQLSARPGEMLNQLES
jgi:hypothetical protein